VGEMVNIAFYILPYSGQILSFVAQEQYCYKKAGINKQYGNKIFS
jgi:hypothetical protein